MIIVGLTGGYGTGKTTVARILKRLGAYIIDADKIAHELIRPGSIEYKKIISLFGKKILKDGSPEIDRSRLGRIVFSDKKALLRLNKIIHPEVIFRVKEALKKVRGKVVVIDAPLLIEAGMRSMVDKLIVVKANRYIQLRRLVKKTRLQKKDLLRRINFQIRLQEKLRLADFAIDNNGTKSATREQVVKIWKKLPFLGNGGRRWRN